nr:TolC family protein [Acinetobacter sp. Marseille-Q1620]
MNINIFLVILGYLIIQPAYALDLDEAILASLSYESQLRLNRISVDQSVAELEQAKKSFGLNVNLAGQYDFERIQTPNQVMFPTEGTRNGRGIQLQFDYPVYTSGKQKIGIDAAESQLVAQQHAYLSTKAKTILQTVMVYTDVLKKQALIHLNEQVLSNLMRNQYEANRKYKVGMITRADLAQVEAQVAEGHAELTQAKSDLMVTSAKFFQVTGIFPEKLKEIQFLPKIPESFVQLDHLILQHPSLQQAKFEKKAFENRYRLVKKELSPTVNFTSRLGRQNEATYINSESDNFLVGVQMNVPLYDNGLNRANIKKSQLDIEYADQKIELVRKNLSLDVQRSYSQLLNIRQTKSALNYAIKSATIALNYIKKELEFGTKTTFELLTAEQKLLDVQTRQVINNQDEVVLTYQILELIGQLDSEEISKK